MSDFYSVNQQMSAPLQALNDLGFWCKADVLGAIVDGSFAATCNGSLTSSEPGNCGSQSQLHFGAVDDGQLPNTTSHNHTIT